MLTRRICDGILVRKRARARSGPIRATELSTDMLAIYDMRLSSMLLLLLLPGHENAACSVREEGRPCVGPLIPVHAKD